MRVSSQHKHSFVDKIDWIGPINNRPSTDWVRRFVFYALLIFKKITIIKNIKRKFNYLKVDMGYMTRDTRQVTHDTAHMAQHT